MLFYIRKTSLAKYDFDSHDIDPFFEGEEEVNDEDDLSIKIKSIFQMIYYQLHHGRKKCPLHIMNALARAL